MTKKEITIISLLAILAVITLIPLVLGETPAEQAYLQTANNTDLNGTLFNTQTPTISARCVGYNVTSFNMSIFNQTSASPLASRIVLNGSWTNVTLISVSTRERLRLNISCANATNNVANGTMISIMINGRPTISGVGTSSAVILKNSIRAFDVNWSDNHINPNGTIAGTDNVTVYVCKTNVFGNNCSSVWCQSAINSNGAGSCNYTIEGTLTAGNKESYVFVMDDNTFPVSSATNKNFTVSSGGGDGDEDQVTTTITTTQIPWTEKTVAGIIKLPLLILILVIIAIAIIIVYYNRRK